MVNIGLIIIADVAWDDVIPCKSSNSLIGQQFRACSLFALTSTGFYYRW